MNDSLDHKIDLLVDGELPEDKRSDLLRQLEQEPDAWKNCALRFLEAQAFLEAFEAQNVVDLPGSSGKKNTLWLMPLGAAAAAFLGFFLANQTQPSLQIVEKEVLVEVPAVHPTGFQLIPSGEALGGVALTSYEKLPEDVLNAFREGGHHVEELVRVVPLSYPESEISELQLRATHIVLNPKF